MGALAAKIRHSNGRQEPQDIRQRIARARIPLETVLKRCLELYMFGNRGVFEGSESSRHLFKTPSYAKAVLEPHGFEYEQESKKCYQSSSLTAVSTAGVSVKSVA